MLLLQRTFVLFHFLISVGTSHAHGTQANIQTKHPHVENKINKSILKIIFRDLSLVYVYWYWCFAYLYVCVRALDPVLNCRAMVSDPVLNCRVGAGN